MLGLEMIDLAQSVDHIRIDALPGVIEAAINGREPVEAG